MASKPILFILSHGHGSGADRGAASGKFIELELTKAVTRAVYKKLLEIPASKRSWRVDYSERRVNGYTLAEQAEIIKNYQDRYRTVSIDIHFNAGGGDGAEVWVPKAAGTRRDTGEQLGQWILDEFKKVGQNSRGVKYSDDLYFLKHPQKGIAALVECGFVDNKTDREGFDTNKELKAYGEAIANALIKYAEKYE